MLKKKTKKEPTMNFPPIGNGEPWNPQPDPTVVMFMELAKGVLQALQEKHNKQAARDLDVMEEQVWWEAAQAYDSTWQDKIKHADAIRAEFIHRFRK